jgi:hypothetical protein
MARQSCKGIPYNKIRETLIDKFDWIYYKVPLLRDLTPR